MEAIIYKPTKNVMQSGRGCTKKWVLEYARKNTRFIEPLMGWTGNYDTSPQVRLKFDNKEDAIAYAKKHKIPYKLIESKQPKIIIRSYADNFRK